MFWGDRYGMFTDPYGHTWGVATHKEDLTNEEIEKRAREFWASMQAQRKSA
jgi:PhnB protein